MIVKMSMIRKMMMTLMMMMMMILMMVILMLAALPGSVGWAARQDGHEGTSWV